MPNDVQGELNDDRVENSNDRDRKSKDPNFSFKRIGQLFFLSGKDFFIDNGPQWAAAIAYYSLLSLFPLLLAITSIGAYFVAIVVIIIFWSWLVAMIVLFGGEVTSHYEAMFVEDLSIEEIEEKHRRRSPTFTS
jgi:uncharacterized BrkB/YihY/UPF0761 family membrane protein